MEDKFRLLSERIATLAGTPWCFLWAACLIILWAVSGPLFDYSDTWQLVVNTGTTIVTFLMVFLIQNTQNRDAVAVQLKLDELLRSVKGARTELINLDLLSDADLARLRQQFEELGKRSEGDLSLSIETHVRSQRSDSDKKGPSTSESESRTEIELKKEDDR